MVSKGFVKEVIQGISHGRALNAHPSEEEEGGKNMDFTELTKYFVLVVMVACLVVGYILKTAFPKVPNNKIPVILALLGAVLNGFVSGWTIEAIVYGALMGLASTGLHQAFTRFIENQEQKQE